MIVKVQQQRIMKPKFRRLEELRKHILEQNLPYQIGVEGQNIHIVSFSHPMERQFLEELDRLGFLIQQIIHLKEIGLSITIIEPE